MREKPHGKPEYFRPPVNPHIKEYAGKLAVMPNIPPHPILEQKPVNVRNELGHEQS